MLPTFLSVSSLCTQTTRLNALYGALIGDALGVPHEFKPASAIPAGNKIDFVMGKGYQKTYAQIPYGTWSDDGSQMLCLLASLKECPDFDLSDFARRLQRWHQEAYMQSGGCVFDCGQQTRIALMRLATGITPELAGGSARQSNGNGSLMRVLPVALIPELTPKQAISIAMRQSLVTHGHVLSQVCCALYVQLALMIQKDKKAPPDWTEAVIQAALQISPLMPSDAHSAALEEILEYGCHECPSGSGYVVDSLWSAIWALNQGRNYLSAVRAAISLGNDTDTTACITGGLAGLAYGLDDVPDSWFSNLKVPAEAGLLLERY